MRVTKTCVPILAIPGVGCSAQESGGYAATSCRHRDHVSMTNRGAVAVTVADIAAGAVARFYCRADVVESMTGEVLQSTAVLCCKACARRFMEG